MNEVEARDFLPGLGESFTHRELIKAYRKQSLVVHPDTGGTEYEFRLLQESYELLKKKAVHDLGAEVHELQTIDGTPLTELGQGLPIMVNAIACDVCEGRGYKIFSKYTREVECSACEGEGTFFLPCKKCGGTGDYRHPRSNKVIGKCNLCGGNGRFYPVYKKPSGRERYFVWTTMFDDTAKWVRLPNGTERKVNACRECSGSGRRRIEDDTRPSYVKCSKCDGCGEERIYNPVLPVGYLMSGSSKQK